LLFLTKSFEQEKKEIKKKNIKKFLIRIVLFLFKIKH
jgi:hypothetical protein